MTTAAINNLWIYLQGLALTSDESLWLSDKLAENAKRKQENTKRELIREKFKDLQISPEVKAMTGSIKMTDLDLTDERTRYILSK